MKWWWIIMLAVSCSTATEDRVGELNHNELAKRLGISEIQLIDVRTPEEVSSGRIAGAQHIDFYDPQFTLRISKLDKEVPVVVYCASGGRSARATDILAGLGFREVYDLTGGFRSWQAAGHPVELER